MASSLLLLTHIFKNLLLAPAVRGLLGVSERKMGPRSLLRSLLSINLLPPKTHPEIPHLL